MSTKRPAETDNTPKRDADVQGGEAKRQCTNGDVCISDHSDAGGDCSSSSGTSSSSTGPDDTPYVDITVEQLKSVLPKVAVLYTTGGDDYTALNFERACLGSDMEWIWLAMYAGVDNDDIQQFSESNTTKKYCEYDPSYIAHNEFDGSDAKRALKFAYRFIDYDDTKHRTFWILSRKKIAQAYVEQQQLANNALKRAVTNLCKNKYPDLGK